MLYYTQGVVAYDSVFFLGCISRTFTPRKVKSEALILIFVGGTDTTVWNNVHFFMFDVPKIDLYHQLWNLQVERHIRQPKKIRVVSFLSGNKFEQATNHTHFCTCVVSVPLHVPIHKSSLIFIYFYQFCPYP